MVYLRGRGLVENEEQDENKMMKSIVVEEQEQEQEQEEGSETRFVDLDKDTLLNVLKRVDVFTLGRAACVNKLWRKVAEDDGLWESVYISFWASRGLLWFKDTLLKVLVLVDLVTLGQSAGVNNRRWRMVARDKRLLDPISIDRLRTVTSLQRFRRMVISVVAKPPPDFYSIDFSKMITPWR